MKQILQNLKTGATELTEVPCPRLGSGRLLIRTTRSLISAGTERMLVEFGKTLEMKQGQTLQSYQSLRPSLFALAVNRDKITLMLA